MVYLESPSTNPHFNLALEQYVFDEMDKSQDYFMLWQNDNAIIVGKYQNTAQEINQDFVRSHGIRVVRRLSGGGAVYHDLGNLNFTFITNAQGAGLDFGLFCRQIAGALAAFGVQAEVSGRNDITIRGRKFSGNSQYVKQGRVMHHGTILFDSDLSIISQALRVPKDKYQSKGVPSVRSRVANVKEFLREDISLEQFKHRLVTNMFAAGQLARHTFTRQELAGASALQQSRYDLWDWNFGASPSHAIEKRRRVEGCGTVTLHMEVSGGAITAFRAHGDFFGNGDMDELAALMLGLRPEAGALQSALAGVDVGHYISGLPREEFIRLVAE